MHECVRQVQFVVFECLFQIAKEKQLDFFLRRPNQKLQLCLLNFNFEWRFFSLTLAGFVSGLVLYKKKTQEQRKISTDSRSRNTRKLEIEQESIQARNK